MLIYRAVFWWLISSVHNNNNAVLFTTLEPSTQVSKRSPVTNVCTHVNIVQLPTYASHTVRKSHIGWFRDGARDIIRLHISCSKL